MKKLLFLIFVLLCVTNSQAQLQPKMKVEKTNEVFSGRMGTLKLIHSNATGYKVLFLATGNRFDEGAYFKLGNTKEEALATFNDLTDLFESLKDGSILVVENAGRDVTIKYRRMSGFDILQLNIPGIAGDQCRFDKGIINKMIRKLEEYEEKNK